MAIIALGRWKGNYAQVLPIAREAAAFLKRHGATSVLIGSHHTGPATGQIYIATTYPDWATYGGTQQARAADAEFQRVFAELTKIIELQELSFIVAEEL